MVYFRLTPADRERMRRLVQRDEISGAEFLRRAILAYELMYSRDA